MPHAFLPVDGRIHLCRTEGPEVRVLAGAPGKGEADFVFSRDGSHFSVLDNGNKRAGLFRLLPEAPWFERVLSFASLPRRCQGHAHAVAGGGLLVGGHGSTGESLWIRKPGDGDRWTPVPIPEQLRHHGKAVDGLLIEGRRIIAVDDIVMPKWVIVYEADDAGNLQPEEVTELPCHTSYERIRRCALGPGMVGLISSGFNHGTSSRFVSILGSADFMEWALWSAHEGPEDEGEERMRPPLMRACDLGFLRGRLVIACGGFGLLVADLRGWSPVLEDPGPHPHSTYPEGPELRPIDVPGLAIVERLVLPLGEEAGLFAVGKGLDGERAYGWVAVD